MERIRLKLQNANSKFANENKFTLFLCHDATNAIANIANIANISLIYDIHLTINFGIGRK